MDIINGADGYYIIKNSKLVKIVGVKYSDRYFLETGGTAEYMLEDGTIIIRKE